MDARAEPASPGTQAAAPRRRRIVLWTLLGVLLVVIAVVAAGLWIGSRALAAKDSLQRAETLVGQLKDSLTADPDAAPALAKRLVADTASARHDTDGTLWRMGEGVPVLGVNLSVVRRLAASVDDVARHAVQPLATVGTSAGRLRPVDGALDLAQVRSLVDTVTSADATLRRARDEVRRIDADGAIGEVASARDRLARLLDDAAGMSEPAAKAASLLVPMLGGDGPRTYLLMFQNPAEANSLGGNPASLLLLGVDQGRISVLRQASSGDFPSWNLSPIPLDPSLEQTYDLVFQHVIMDTGTRPDFPTMAQLGKGYWEREFGGHIDAVMSFDPIALADLLKVTGPIALPSGDTLTSENAVPLLLNEVYARYPGPKDSDAFFAATAGAVLQTILSGQGLDVAKLLPSLEKAVGEGRLMAWSERPEEQKVIAGTPFSGILQPDSADATALGVYFNDNSVSKMDYFLDTAVEATADACPAQDGVFTAKVTVSSRLKADQVAGLPAYVASAFLPAGQANTDVYVLGPSGSTYLDYAVDAPGISQQLVNVGSDLGRPVVKVNTLIGAEGSSAFTVRFTRPAADTGALTVRTTPMVNPTTVAVAESSCG